MRKKYSFFLLAAFSFLVTLSHAQMPDSVKNHLDSALAILKQHSLYADTVNWPVVEKQVYAKAANAKTKAQTFEALTLAFMALGDKHAAYYQYEDAYRLPDTTLEKRYNDSIKEAWKQGPRLMERITRGMAYINIPTMPVHKQKDIDWYANWVYAAIAKLAAEAPAGWIIDLRLNAGGNIRPMMAGLAMFFNNEIVSYYIDKNGMANDEASFKNGDFCMNGEVQATIKNKIPALGNAKVAVLIGPGTASSGEGVAANFKQRKNTRLFGEVSSGRANSTLGFPFNNDQSYFLISSAFIGDKNKKPLPEFVLPHVTVKANNAFTDPLSDNVVRAAIDWLKQN